jgi:hypothetical protein
MARNALSVGAINKITTECCFAVFVVADVSDFFGANLKQPYRTVFTAGTVDGGAVNNKSRRRSKHCD